MKDLNSSSREPDVERGFELIEDDDFEVTVVRFHDSVDALNVTDVIQQLEDLLLADQPHRVVLNLTSVPFIQSVTLGWIIGLDKIVRSYGGMLRLCELQENVRRVFEVTQVTSVLSICNDEAAAITNYWDDDPTDEVVGGEDSVELDMSKLEWADATEVVMSRRQSSRTLAQGQKLARPRALRENHSVRSGSTRQRPHATRKAGQGQSGSGAAADASGTFERIAGGSSLRPSAGQESEIAVRDDFSRFESDTAKPAADRTVVRAKAAIRAKAAVRVPQSPSPFSKWLEDNGLALLMGLAGMIVLVGVFYGIAQIDLGTGLSDFEVCDMVVKRLQTIHAEPVSEAELLAFADEFHATLLQVAERRKARSAGPAGAQTDALLRSIASELAGLLEEVRASKTINSYKLGLVADRIERNRIRLKK